MSKQRSILLVTTILTIAAVSLTVAQQSPAQATKIKSYDSTSYGMQRAKIKNNDPQEVYKLARLFWSKNKKDVKLLKFLAADLKQASKSSKSRRIKALLNVINAKIKELQGDDEPTSDGNNPTGSGTTKLLNDDQINWIKIKELSAADKNIRITFRNNLIDRYIKMMKNSNLHGWDNPAKARNFKRYSAYRQAREIISNLADNPKMLADIRIKGDPKFIKTFKSRVWPTVRNTCGQVSCHGGVRANGGFKLIRSTAKANKVLYTNFMILRGLKLGGSFADEKIINSQDTEKSLLLQFLLNPKVAEEGLNHPKKIRTIFRNTKSGDYKRILAWIDSLKGPVAPNYRFKWKAPYGMTVLTEGDTIALP